MTLQTVQLIAGCGTLAIGMLPRLWTPAVRVGFVVLATSLFGGWQWLQLLVLVLMAVANVVDGLRARRKRSQKQAMEQH